MQANLTVESIIDAANSFKLGLGSPLEALLGSFEDLHDYRDAVKTYKDEGGPDTFVPPDVCSYAALAVAACPYHCCIMMPLQLLHAYAVVLQAYTCERQN